MFGSGDANVEQDGVASPCLVFHCQECCKGLTESNVICNETKGNGCMANKSSLQLLGSQ